MKSIFTAFVIGAVIVAHSTFAADSKPGAEDTVAAAPDAQTARIIELIETLGDDALMHAATDELLEIGEPAIPHLIERFNTRHWSTAAQVIKKMGEPTYAPLALALRDKDRRNRAAAIIKDIGEPMIPLLIAELEEMDSRLRAGKLLEGIGDPAVPELIKLLRSKVDPNEGRIGWVAIRAIDALTRLNSPIAVNALLTAHDDNATRNNAEKGLLKCGRTAVAGVIERSLKSDKPETRASGIRILFKLKADAGYRPILKMLTDPAALVRREAAFGCRDYRRKSAVPKLLPLLTDKDEEVRAAVISALTVIPHPDAIPALAKALHDPVIRVTASAALEEIGKEAIPILLQLGEHDNPDIRRLAFEALAPLKDTRAVPLYVSHLSDKNAGIRRAAASGLRKLGTDATPHLIKLLTASKSTDRSAAADILARSGDERAVDAVLALLTDNTAAVRVSAIKALGKVKLSRTVPALIPMVKDPDRHVRIQAARALAGIADVRSVPALIEAMSEPRLHTSLYRAMERIGPPAATHLVKGLNHKNDHVRAQSARGLSRIKLTVAPKELIAALEDSAADVRQHAAASLGQIKDRAAVLSLITAAEDKDFKVRYNAVNALVVLDDERAIPALVNALGEKRLRITATTALERVGNAAVPALLEALRTSDDDGLRIAVIEVFEDLDDPRTIDAMIEALPHKRVRQFAAMSLGRIGKKALGPVTAALKDSDPGRRIGAALALREMADPTALPVMVEGLQDDEHHVREYLAEGLGKMGAEAATAVTVMIPLLKDEDKDVRYKATVAFGLIKDIRAVPALIDAAADDEVDIEAIRSIEKMGDAAIPVIIAGLKNETPRSRECTSIVMERMLRPAFLPAMSRALMEDDTPIVRQTVARAMGKLGDPKAVPALRYALIKDEDWTVRKEAASSIGRIGDPAGVDALVHALADDKFGVTWNAQRALEAIGHDAVPQILRQLKNSDPDTRSRAVKSLIPSGDPRAMDALIGVLEDDDGFVRRDACIALGRIGDPAAVEHLIAVFGRDKNRAVRYRAIDAMSVILDRTPAEDQTGPPKWETLPDAKLAVLPAALGVFAKAMGDKAMEVRKHAVRAMAKTGDPSSIAAVVNALNDTHNWVRGEAVTTLKAYALSDYPHADGEGPLVPRLRKVLAHGSAEGRDRALEVFFSDLLDPRTVTLLADQLSSNSAAKIRAAIARRFAGLANQRGTWRATIRSHTDMIVDRIKNDTDDGTRVALLIAIGNLRDTANLEHVLNYLDAKNSAIMRAAALRALGRIYGAESLVLARRPVAPRLPKPDPGMVHRIAGLLADRDNGLDGAAAEALTGLGQYAAADLFEALKSSDAQVRTHAIICLGRIGDKAATLEVFAKMRRDATSKGDREVLARGVKFLEALR